MDPEKPPPLKVTATRLARAVAVFANSEAGSKAAWLFAALLALLLAANGLTVVNSFVGRNFMTAIVDRREAEFVRLAIFYVGVFAASTIVAVVARFAEERLGLLWRDSLSREMLKLYLANGAYCRLAASGEVANPDQRIAEDVRALTASTLSFALMAFNSVVTIVAFAGVMFSISLVLSAAAAGRSDVNLHYGSEPDTKFYSHLSDQYGYFSILPISPSESEAPYVLDGLFDHEFKLDIDEHYTDTGGSSDHVFGLFALLGRRFAPRLRNLKDRKFHTFEKPDTYPALKTHLGARINIDLIRDNWDELLRMAASMNERIVAPSAILRKLSASKKPSELARALREVGRLERTRFMIEWYCDPKLRRRCLGGLNKGESAHKLKRAVFFHERGEVRDRSFDSQAFRALRPQSRRQCNRSLEYGLRRPHRRFFEGQGRTIPGHLLKHVSPISWEHINLTGIYSWRTEPTDPTSFRPLREEKSVFGQAA